MKQYIYIVVLIELTVRKVFYSQTEITAPLFRNRLVLHLPLHSPHPLRSEAYEEASEMTLDFGLCNSVLHFSWYHCDCLPHRLPLPCLFSLDFLICSGCGPPRSLRHEARVRRRKVVSGQRPYKFQACRLRRLCKGWRQLSLHPRITSPKPTRPVWNPKRE